MIKYVRRHRENAIRKKKTTKETTHSFVITKTISSNWKQDSYRTSTLDCRSNYIVN